VSNCGGNRLFRVLVVALSRGRGRRAGCLRREGGARLLPRRERVPRCPDRAADALRKL